MILVIFSVFDATSKAEVNAPAFDGKMALHYAAENGHCACVDKLIRKGAKVNPVLTKSHHDLMVISYELFLCHHEFMMMFGVNWEQFLFYISL